MYIFSTYTSKKIVLINEMYSSSKYSAGENFSLNLSQEISFLEAIFMNHMLALKSVLFKPTVYNAEYKNYLKDHVTEIQQVSPRPQNRILSILKLLLSKIYFFV